MGERAWVAALVAGDTGAVVGTFAPDGYFHEPARTPPTAGAGGLLAAARIYHDIEPPAGHPLNADGEGHLDGLCLSGANR